MCKKPYYITTPIYYPSTNLHIGNTYTTVAADAIARFKRLTGYDVMFLTGTDEHGQKIQRIAEEKGITPIEHVNEIVAGIKDLWKMMNISYDKFIRTTDDYHVKAVQDIFKKLYDKGDIYKSSYEGLYCTPCESFWTETQLVNGNCPDCGRPVEKSKEEAYFFQMSKYAERLIKYIEEHPDFILPHSRRNEVISFIKQGLQDLSISRNTFTWGIPIDFAPGHITYVWFDALTNYITSAGFENDENKFDKFWNNARVVHLIGKDIIRFHAIIWPCMLLSAGIKLPDSIVAHGWWTSEGEKMSKSRGNVVNPYDEIKKYGVDAFRYYLLREANFGTDGDYSTKGIIGRLNSDLANDLGNLLNRTLGMYKKYFNGVIVSSSASEAIDEEIKSMFNEVIKDVEKYMYLFEFSRALESIWRFISRLNKYIDETMPWALAKDEAKKDRLAAVMNVLCESLYKIAFLIAPYMPMSAQKISNQLGIDKDITDVKFDDVKEWNIFKEGHKLGEASPIFPRIEIEKEEVVETKKELKIENPVDIKEFNKIEIKVVEILEVDKVEGADKLLKFKVFDGEFERQIISGLAKFYPDFKKLVGEKVLAVANLKFTKLKGEISQGMLLTTEDKNGVSLIKIDKSVQAGAIVS